MFHDNEVHEERPSGGWVLGKVIYLRFPEDELTTYFIHDICNSNQMKLTGI